MGSFAPCWRHQFQNLKFENDSMTDVTTVRRELEGDMTNLIYIVNLLLASLHWCLVQLHQWLKCAIELARCWFLVGPLDDVRFVLVIAPCQILLIRQHWRLFQMTHSRSRCFQAFQTLVFCTLSNAQYCYDEGHTICQHTAVVENLPQGCSHLLQSFATPSMFAYRPFHGAQESSWHLVRYATYYDTETVVFLKSCLSRGRRQQNGGLQRRLQSLWEVRRGTVFSYSWSLSF